MHKHGLQPVASRAERCLRNMHVGQHILAMLRLLSRNGLQAWLFKIQQYPLMCLAKSVRQQQAQKHVSGLPLRQTGSSYTPVRVIPLFGHDWLKFLGNTSTFGGA